jgi:hypothetical protein
MGSRWYDPKLGRFLSRDTAPATSSGVNRGNFFLYGAGNPLAHIDPDGHNLRVVNAPFTGTLKVSTAAAYDGYLQSAPVAHLVQPAATVDYFQSTLSIDDLQPALHLSPVSSVYTQAVDSTPPPGAVFLGEAGPPTALAHSGPVNSASFGESPGIRACTTCSATFDNVKSEVETANSALHVLGKINKVALNEYGYIGAVNNQYGSYGKMYKANPGNAGFYGGLRTSSKVLRGLDTAGTGVSLGLNASVIAGDAPAIKKLDAGVGILSDGADFAEKGSPGLTVALGVYKTNARIIASASYQQGSYERINDCYPNCSEGDFFRIIGAGYDRFAQEHLTQENIGASIDKIGETQRATLDGCWPNCSWHTPLTMTARGVNRAWNRFWD